MKLKLVVRASLVMLVAASVAACGAADTGAGAGAPSPDAPPALKGELTVGAAASLTEVFTDLGEAFSAEHSDVEVAFNFGASSAIVEQIRSGAPVDVVATADGASMDKIADQVQDRTTFARNSLQIVVESGNPLGIKELSDLAADRVTLVLCAVEVPCGSLAAEAFSRAGVTPSPRSLEASVKGVVSKVSLGEADAGVAYVSDVMATPSVDGVPIPAKENVVTDYPVARVAASENSDLADAFIEFLLSDQAQGILAEAGFTSP